MKAKLGRAGAVLVSCLSAEVMALGDWGRGDPSRLKNVFGLFWFCCCFEKLWKYQKPESHRGKTQFKVTQNALKFGPPLKEKDRSGGVNSEKETNISFCVDGKP